MPLMGLECTGYFAFQVFGTLPQGWSQGLLSFEISVGLGLPCMGFLISTMGIVKVALSVTSTQPVPFIPFDQTTLSTVLGLLRTTAKAS